MILYNVTVKIEPAIKEEWMRWMKNKHIPDVMATGYFTGHRISRLLEQNDEEGITYVVQYQCSSLQKYNDYIALNATALREEHNQKFKGQFVAFRTIMEVV